SGRPAAAGGLDLIEGNSATHAGKRGVTHVESQEMLDTPVSGHL
ncbi:MAG: hypothetical protein QOG46_2433, partial [Pseudonocardiales bacterium]|nr:hypothetical protein [Pseudonocardiales bacterium]